MFRSYLSAALAGTLTEADLDRLESHHRLLLRWNRVLNLTRIESEKEAAELHYAESIFVGRQLPSGSLRIVDVGSGGGFPGFPIAVTRPECSVTLVESHQRKGVFLRESARDVKNLRVIGGRAESVEERFDWVVSRAVSLADVERIASKLAPNLAFVGSCGEIRIPWGVNRFLHLRTSST